MLAGHQLSANERNQLTFSIILIHYLGLRHVRRSEMPAAGRTASVG